MSLCTECQDYPVGTRCSAATCPARVKVRPIALADGEGWPFQMLGRLPYRPTNFNEWAAGVRADLRSAFHAQENSRG
jgi:hypothetical protein